MSGTKLPLQRRKEKEQLTVEKDASCYLQNMVQETSLSKNAWDRDAGVPGQIGQVLCLVKTEKAVSGYNRPRIQAANPHQIIKAIRTLTRPCLLLRNCKMMSKAGYLKEFQATGKITLSPHN